MIWAGVVLLVYLAARLTGNRPAKLARYTRNLWVAVDQFCNAVIGGDEDETLSSRAGKAARNGHPWPARIIDLLVFAVSGQRGHCADCIEDDEGRNAL